MRYFIVGCLLLSLSSEVSAQKVGETIVVIAANEAEIREGVELKGTILRGAQLRVEKVNGEWFYIKYRNYKGKDLKGWLNRKDIMPLNPINKVINFYSTAINQNPTAKDYNSRGMLYYSISKFDLAIDDYSQSVRLDSKQPFHWHNRGLALTYKREYAKATKDFDEAIRLDSKQAKFWVSRGNAWRYQSKNDQAIRNYNEAIQLQPNYTIALNSRADVWFLKQEYGKAIQDYSKIVQIDPNFWYAWGNLAMLRATCLDAKYRDGKQALKDAKRACELTHWKNGYALTPYAAALAELGKFDEAVEQLEKAISINPQEDKSLRLSLLKQYKAKQPHSKN